MKKRILLLLAPLICFLSTASIPTLVYRFTDRVIIVKPNTITYQKTLTYTGEIMANETREIYLETPVIPSAVLVEPGDLVEKGSILAHIDTDLTQKVLSQGAIVTEKDQQIQQVKNLYSEYQRKNNLSDEAIMQVFGSQKESIATDPAFVPANILSPMDGIVTEVKLAENVLCSANGAAMVIRSSQNSKVVIQLRQSDVDEIALGTPAQIQGEGLGGKMYHGIVTKIHPTAQTVYKGLTSETVVQTELTITDSDEAAKSGYIVQVALMPEEIKDYFSLPYETIRQDEDNQEYVWIVEHGRAVRRDVVTGSELPDGVEIISGIAHHDRVICDPGELQHGQLVIAKGEGED